MKHSNHFLLLIFSAFLLLSLNAFRCDKWPCIKGEGNAVTQNRDIAGTSRIDMQSFAHVNITKGSSYSCSLSGQQNILDNLIFTREGDKLVIAQKDCVKDHLDVTINITLPSLTWVKLGGSGDINVTGAFNEQAFAAILSGSGNIHINDAITADNLHTEISGSGNITLKGSFKKAESMVSGSGDISITGKSDAYSVNISGSGKIHAFNLSTSNANIHTSGSGDVEVSADNTLDVKISGSGNVEYRGNPAVMTHISGSGKVNKRSNG